MATMAAILKNLFYSVTHLPFEGFQWNLIGMFSTLPLLSVIICKLVFKTNMSAVAAILKNLFHTLTQVPPEGFQRNLMGMFSTHPWSSFVIFQVHFKNQYGHHGSHLEKPISYLNSSSTWGISLNLDWNVQYSSQIKCCYLASWF